MIPFSDFMGDWLYGKDGYYSSMPNIGKKGDFATSVTTSMFFGGAIAKHFLSLIEGKKLSPKTSIIEIGAHHGYLIADIVQFLYTLKPDLLDTLKFIIVEPQENIEKAQREYLKDSFGDEVKFTWYKSLKEFKTDEAFVVCNELFDAFVCEVVKDEKMLYVKNGELVFDKLDDFTKQICEKYNITKGEVAKGYEEFCSDLSNAVNKCEFLTFDYGDINPRGDISLRVYKEHSTYPFFSLTDFVKDKNSSKPNIKELYKKSDLTYDVNFSHLFDAMNLASFKKVGFSTQAKALVDFGIIELLEMLKNNTSEDGYRYQLSKVMQLIEPSQLGERFRMARFQKGIK
ncbi:MAG: SAM-dependent methyltransferase [Campylobacteraceae bacterium]|jgi:SAM-dependent MidA family methyltransferase|nr:SAM-dependent methyltransferase [Campylobacteraceae bacterium]